MNLDKDQMNAVKYLGNALVIAGAGSGKTTTIVAKINYLIENNYYKEKEILVISFTNETVNSLKLRIKYDLDIKTFHKLGLDIIKDKNITICPNNYLNYIIDEYFNSYVLNNKQAHSRVNRILNNNNLNNLKRLISSFINLYKANYSDILYLYRLYKYSFFINKDYLRIILEIYQIYQNELKSAGMIDFNDMITYATKLINNKEIMTNYKYIIIDEFQDSSLVRFKLIKSIIDVNKSKLFVVGDDYQSIYRFSGCDLDIFLNLDKYIPDLKKLFINHNYRNNQSLINVANSFILKNKKQMKKETICHKDVDKPIVIYFYHDEKDVINKIIDNIEGNILVLGRNNRDKERFNVNENEQIKFLTIHKSKGLEEDNVILINLGNSSLGFPSKIENDQLISKVLKEDYIIYEEERRLMYVALTRTKNKIYILVPSNNYSSFIKEIIHDYKNYLEIKQIKK